MIPESDAGIDKQKVLAAIAHPEPTPYAPLTIAPPSPYRPPSATRRAVAPPPDAWSTHRSEIAAIVATFVSLIWITMGVAGGSGTALLVGVAFGIGALAIWLLEVWSD